MHPLDYLMSLPRFADQGAAAYRPGLERMEALLAAMGDPHRACPSIHVAGTNGKGSTASFIAAIASAAGRRVGLHTSPHLFDVTERMRVDGRPAPAEWLADAVRRYRAAFDTVGPSFFEATVALSFRYFAEAGADLMVVEVGLGGRLDATNVLAPLAAVVTHIGLDHTDLLGETKAAIAREKAGIFKPGTPVFTAVEEPEPLAVLRAVAAERGAPFHAVADEVRVEAAEAEPEGLRLDVRTPLRRYEDLRLGLPGRHQQSNALLALRTAEACFPELGTSPEAAYTGLRDVVARTGLRGRLDVLQREPMIVLDVGHNPEGLAASLAFLHAEAGSRHSRLCVAFGTMRDKDVAAMARLLAEAKAIVYPVSAGTERALPVDALRRLLHDAGVRTADAPHVPGAVDHFLAEAHVSDALLITGSYLIAAQVPPTLLPPR